jgi:hypothetical protein
MKIFISIIIILSFPFCLSGQNVVLPEGEFMDTTSGQNSDFKDYKVYYYQVGCKYPESSSSLLKEAQTFIGKKDELFSGSGYLTFRFCIDREGKEMKKVQVLQTDENYKSYHFEKKFVNELYSFVKTLDKWKIAKTHNGQPYSYITFVTFKIKNGKIINIIP